MERGEPQNKLFPVWSDREGFFFLICAYCARFKPLVCFSKQARKMWGRGWGRQSRKTAPTVGQIQVTQTKEPKQRCWRKWLTHRLHCRPLTRLDVWQLDAWRQREWMGCAVESLCSSTPKWTRQLFECFVEEREKKGGENFKRQLIFAGMTRISRLFIVISPQGDPKFASLVRTVQE